jgi:hypothetical protein
MIYILYDKYRVTGCLAIYYYSSLFLNSFDATTIILIRLYIIEINIYLAATNVSDVFSTSICCRCPRM